MSGERRELSIHRAKSRLVDALRDHQVVVVQGATGCGKTTQIPQIVRDSGLIDDALNVGVTQPRRIAAVSVAHRIASERGGVIGGEVAYAIRFDDRTTPQTRIKIMTDGLLLQEFRTDPALSRYGVIMVDEAHERSLNIDFTLGLLRQLIDQRRDLRVIVSSATINAAVFTGFFGADTPNIEVEAHTYPIEVRWRPIGDGWGPERDAEIADAISALHKREPAGDMLVFLTGEGEIKHTIAELEARRLRGAAFLPLYGRLTRQEQERVFSPIPNRRKIVLATNIAETSLTIDGVRYVVDLGLAKVPSFDSRTGFPSLRERPISKASARQRAGRSGRTAPGVCVRLYAEEDYEERDEFPTEDIRRMDLSEVVLRLIDLGIREVEAFPFITRPPRRALKDAIRDLVALGAIDRGRNLTDFGRRMVPFPLPPRLACMIVAAADDHPDVFEEVLTAGALLSVRWPQIIPQGMEDEARRAHKAYAHPAGDVAMGLRLVRGFERASDTADFCERNFLDERLMGEVCLIRDQLRDIATAAGLEGGSGGKFQGVARCLMRAFSRGLCQRAGRSNSYETVRNVRVSIHPGSCLWDSRPRFVVAADIVVTSRAWARAVTAIEPAWIREFDEDLGRRWRIRARRRSRRDRPQAPVFPQELSLFGHTYPVRHKRGRTIVEMQWTTLRDASAGGPPPLPEGVADLHVVMKHDTDTLLKATPLNVALKLAPLLRIDEPELDAWPEGELFVAEYELHHILRRLPDLLRIARSRRRKKIAYLTLIPNGAGAFWYDAASDLSLAVEQANLSLASLSREPHLDEADRLDLQRASDKLDEIYSVLTS